MRYVYLHGFASGPQSTKAQALRSHFQSAGLTLHIPDRIGSRPLARLLNLTGQGEVGEVALVEVR
ncbi:MAG: YqiA/YcfP family alpha/beta fold hydrolase, partial [Cyanobacteria bacterium J06633_23]